MKNTLKWIFIVLGGLVLLIILAAILVPVLFKDDIKKAIDKELAKSVNADVIFEVDKFHLSLFTHFPNVTAQMEDLGVVNREPFAGQLLFATKKFEVEINLKDILFGNELSVKGISLIDPVINIKVLKDGRANYDITFPSTDTVASEPGGDFSFRIDHWEIVNGDIVYDDQSIPYMLKMRGMNHEGSGDFSQAVFDLKTHTTIDSVSTGYDGAEYLTDKRVELDATIEISEDYTKFTFKENTAKVNEFAMHFDGFFKMNEKDYGMDITFGSPDNSFKSLLSIVPGMYTDNFKDVETKGDLSFNGFVKGTYSETQMPAFNVDMKVKDAMFKYPDLPTAITNINMDLLIDNKDGVIDNTLVNLKRLHLDFGSNPFDAKMIIENLRDYRMDGMVLAKLNLGELSKMFPLEGLQMKGNYAIDLKAKGVYDSVRNLIPAIDASMSLANGYVKSKDFPIPLENLSFNSTVKNTSGKMAETTIAVNDFAMLLDGEKLTASLLLQDLTDYHWDLKVNGGVDIEKIMKIFPMEGMTITGKAKANIQTKGKYSDVQAERYDKLPTSGTASLTNFTYAAKDLPYTVALSQANMAFDPKKIELQNMDGTIGKSDFSVSGSVMNYIGYALGKGETIKGVVNFNSNVLDLNEFMSDSEETTSTDTTSFGVIEVPKDINFLLRSSIKTVKLMDLTMTNASGDILVKDGVANLNGLKFTMLGGLFAVNGTYDTKDVKHPGYNLGLKIDDMSFQQAANSFSIIKTYAPIAGMVKGNFSTDMKINGELLQNFSPNMKTVNANGLIKIGQAALTNSKILDGITSLTKLDNTNQVKLKDVLMSATITDGKLTVKPFDVKFGDYKTTVAGSTDLAGGIDYTLKMDVPAGKLGAQYQAFINKNTGANNSTEVIPLTIGIGNTFKDPKYTLIGDDQKKQATEAVTNVAKEEGQKAIQNAVKGTEAEKIVNDIFGTSKKDSAAAGIKKDTATANSIDEAKKKVEEDAKKKIQNLLKRK